MVDLALSSTGSQLIATILPNVSDWLAWGNLICADERTDGTRATKRTI